MSCNYTEVSSEYASIGCGEKRIRLEMKAHKNKMCLVVYANGKGGRKGTHISVFEGSKKFLPILWFETLFYHFWLWNW